MPVIRKIQASTNQLLTLQEVKDLLKISHNNEDNYLNILISAVTQAIENYINQSLLFQTWELNTSNYNDGEIELYKDPINSIQAVKFINEDNTETLLTSAEYTLESNTLCINKVLTQSKYIKIEYIAGYGETPADVPDIFLQTALQEIYNKYCSCSGTPDVNSLTEDSKSILAPYRKYHL